MPLDSKGIVRYERKALPLAYYFSFDSSVYCWNILNKNAVKQYITAKLPFEIKLHYITYDLQ